MKTTQKRASDLSPGDLLVRFGHICRVTGTKLGKREVVSGLKLDVITVSHTGGELSYTLGKLVPVFALPSASDLADAFVAGLTKHPDGDANVVMGEAFKHMTGVEPDETNPAMDGKYMPGMLDEVGALWEEAWSLARSRDYQSASQAMIPDLKKYTGRVKTKDGRLSGEYVDWFTDDDDARATFRVIMEEQGHKVKSVTVKNHTAIVEVE